MNSDVNDRYVFVAASPGKGRGVFAARRFCAKELIATNEVIFVSDKDYAAISSTALVCYPFLWDESDETKKYALALGIISLCNHAGTPSCEFIIDLEKATISLIAARDIPAGEELTFDYVEPWGFPWFLSP